MTSDVHFPMVPVHRDTTIYTDRRATSFIGNRFSTIERQKIIVGKTRRRKLASILPK